MATINPTMLWSVLKRHSSATSPSPTIRRLTKSKLPRHRPSAHRGDHPRDGLIVRRFSITAAGSPVAEDQLAARQRKVLVEDRQRLRLYRFISSVSFTLDSSTRLSSTISLFCTVSLSHTVSSSPATSSLTESEDPAASKKHASPISRILNNAPIEHQTPQSIAMARTKNPNRIVRRNGSLYKGGRLLSKGKKNGITKKKRAPPPPPPPPPKKPTSKSGGRCPSRCTECKRGHRKCDGARPCERCITVGRPQNCV